MADNSVAAQQHGPVRTCVGCKATDLRSTLLRVVISIEADGTAVLLVDRDRRLPGRGAWIHDDPRCFDLAERRRAFPRALRHTGTLSTAALRES